MLIGCINGMDKLLYCKGAKVFYWYLEVINCGNSKLHLLLLSL